MPRLSHSSREQTLQKVCPHGIKAAPFFLPMHTQHTLSFPTLSSSVTVTVFATSPPSPSSNSLINDTLHGVPGPIGPLGPSPRPTAVSLSAVPRNCRSAASAAARFMPGPAWAGPMQFGSGLWAGLESPGLASSSWSSCVDGKPQVVPQQVILVNLRRSLKVLLLLLGGLSM